MRRIGMLLSLAVAVPLACVAGGQAAMAQSGDFESDRVIVEFRNRVAMGDVDSLLGGGGFVAEKSLRDSATILVRIPGGWTLEAALENISRRESVAYAGLNYYCRLPEASQISQAFLDADADPYTPGISPDEFYGQYATSQILMALGHSVGTGAGVAVAEIDNGIDEDHSLLYPRLMAGGYDYVDDDEFPRYEAGDCAGHGTFAAGLLALTAPDAAILPIRALDGDGRGTIFDIALGIDHAIAATVDVISMGFTVAFDDHVLRAAIARVELAGIIAVAPAGNDAGDLPQYPAAYASVIGVGAVDNNDLRAEFSNFGPSVDLCAPGVDVYSALPGDDDAWGQWSGTSFATPIVAGLAALVRALHPAAPPAACHRILGWGADDIDALNPAYAGALGDGRINFARTTGYVEPVVALWGIVTDAYGVGREGIQVAVACDGLALEESGAITDGAGRYATALRAGVCDLAFIPPAGSGFETTGRGMVPLLADTAISVVLTAYPRGDLNLDGICDLVDVTVLVNIAFRGAPPPIPEFLADVTCDSAIDIRDVVALISVAFRGAPAPLCP